MHDVGSTDFVRNFSEMKRKAQREPIRVRQHDRTEGYFISPEEFERYESFMKHSTRHHQPADLPDHLKAALDGARMSPGDEHLDGLMDQD